MSSQVKGELLSRAREAKRARKAQQVNSNSGADEEDGHDEVEGMMMMMTLQHLTSPPPLEVAV